MPNKIWCFISGETTTFSVDIDDSKTVDDLKKVIKEEKQVALKAVDANGLTLYRAVLDESDYKEKQTRINKLKRLSESLKECMELDDEEQQLSGFFGKSPQGKRYYTLVQTPMGQSIDSRACDMLRLTYAHSLEKTQTNLENTPTSL